MQTSTCSIHTRFPLYPRHKHAFQQHPNHISPHPESSQPLPVHYNIVSRVYHNAVVLLTHLNAYHTILRTLAVIARNLTTFHYWVTLPARRKRSHQKESVHSFAIFLWSSMVGWGEEGGRGQSNHPQRSSYKVLYVRGQAGIHCLAALTGSLYSNT